MKFPRVTFGAIVTGAALLVLLAAVPSAVREMLETGRVYLFSQQFLDELPQRLTGPGRWRFILQPTIAIVLGWRGGLEDARAGRPAYLAGLLLGGADRRALLRSGFESIRILLATGIVLEALAQLLIFGQVHPGAALVIGPVLIGAPYAAARALANRAARLVRRRAARNSR